MRFNFKLTDRDIKLSHKGLILVIVPVVFEIIFVSYLVKLLADAEHEISVEKKFNRCSCSQNSSHQKCMTPGALPLNQDTQAVEG